MRAPASRSRAGALLVLAAWLALLAGGAFHVHAHAAGGPIAAAAGHLYDAPAPEPGLHPDHGCPLCRAHEQVRTALRGPARLGDLGLAGTTLPLPRAAPTPLASDRALARAHPRAPPRFVSTLT